MSKNAMIGMIISLVLVGGGVFFFLNRDDSGSSNSESSQSASEVAENNSNNENPTFEPLATTDESFVVELETSSEGTPFVGTISYDGNGNSLFEGTFNDDELKFYDVDGKFISCQNDICFALPDGQNGVDRSTYEFDAETINDFRNDAVYAGKADCPAGTCDKWTVNNQVVDTVFYVSEDGRISKAEGTTGGSTFTAVFSYEPVTITAPENVREFPLQ
jgi:hypothetical protein